MKRLAIGALMLTGIFTVTQSGAQNLDSEFENGKKAIPKLEYPWPHGTTQTVETRFETPDGYRRIAVKDRSFGRWLRNLPVKPGRPRVRLFNGKPKKNQEAHAAVLDIDVGDRDLQQCADAVMRLWAEYLRSISREDLICFRAASGATVRWSKWQDGYRPTDANAKGWDKTAKPSSRYRTFQRYLQKVFGVANSASIKRQMTRVNDPKAVRPGDVYIQGATKRGVGHAVVVVDVAENPSGNRRFLLAQSYMPAQEIHILKNPQNAESPWYKPTADGAMITPEWTFKPGSLYRFKEGGC